MVSRNYPWGRLATGAIPTYGAKAYVVPDFEKENNGLVYHVIKSHTTIGLMYSLLYVSEYEEEWEMDMEDLGTGHALAYVVNKDMPDCSEFGTIGIEPSIGGLRRTW